MARSFISFLFYWRKHFLPTTLAFFPHKHKCTTSLSALIFNSTVACFGSVISSTLETYLPSFLPLSLDLFIPTFHIWFRCNGAFTLGNLGFCAPNVARGVIVLGCYSLFPWIAAKLIPIHPEIRFHFAWFNFGGGITHTHTRTRHWNYNVCAVFSDKVFMWICISRSAQHKIHASFYAMILTNVVHYAYALCHMEMAYTGDACMLSETWESLCFKSGIFWFSFCFYLCPALGHMQWNLSAIFTHTHTPNIFLTKLNPLSA